MSLRLPHTHEPSQEIPNVCTGDGSQHQPCLPLIEMNDERLYLFQNHQRQRQRQQQHQNQIFKISMLQKFKEFLIDQKTKHIHAPHAPTHHRKHNLEHFQTETLIGQRICRIYSLSQPIDSLSFLYAIQNSL